MKFTDITTDAKNTYSLKKNEKCVFFLQNRSGKITFELSGEHAEAHIFALFDIKETDQHALEIIQHHQAPHTTSRALVKSVIHDTASFSYQGTVRIDKNSEHSEATQENRNLLLSEKATASTMPILEILNPNVVCHHAATTSAPRSEQLFALASRGINPQAAKKLIAEGFKKELTVKMNEIL